MADADMTDKWLAYADDDLYAAERDLTIYPPIQPWIVCFHAQQASEKAIKAVIVSITNDTNAAPKTHDLADLLNLVKTMTGNGVDAKWYEAAYVLTPYATLTRYPNEILSENLDESHAQAAVAMAKELVAWSKAVIGARSKNE